MWVKLKATVVKPLRGGSKWRKKGRAPKKWRENLERWIIGDWETVWNESCLLENQRRASHIKRAARYQSNNKLQTSREETEEKSMKTWMRAKRIVNNGEFSKAAREINEDGVTEPTESVLVERKSKYSKN